MLYLARKHKLPKLRSPIGYLRHLLEAPPAPEDFESLRDYKERLRREREEQERRTREELRRREEAERLIREWQALPEAERQKWLEAARKHEMSRWVSAEMVARMLWHQEVRKQQRQTSKEIEEKNSSDTLKVTHISDQKPVSVLTVDLPINL